jgi:hypothetical protein
VIDQHQLQQLPYVQPLGHQQQQLQHSLRKTPTRSGTRATKPPALHTSSGRQHSRSGGWGLAMNRFTVQASVSRKGSTEGGGLYPTGAWVSHRGCVPAPHQRGGLGEATTSAPPHTAPPPLHHASWPFPVLSISCVAAPRAGGHTGPAPPNATSAHSLGIG